MIRNRLLKIILLYQALKLRAIQMYRIARQCHFTILEQLFTVRALFQFARHNGHSAQRQHLLCRLLCYAAAQLRVTDKYNALGLPIIQADRDVDF